ncbi:MULTISPECIES: hypothetical protein [unclassified Leeuwenhoekiella]|uniref:hypothetical protein n=1 Tax=unclassified Leeuwenhoekiella TaxID=2615029 RepID=UPI000C522C9C|nr:MULTISPECIES: hypothetical protein [unclassified Leeuwenhoekiella]MAW94325.1 hypothetical protein [Leeuwenhoekiella sp.]MBA83006.1 hypothetical protein [Leeuwenhoekiella sp.]|tara:strand:- start:1419 stop:1703 length:285 start_codon:yes stop_codon:yes gene_type:complete
MKSYTVYRNIRKRAVIFGLPVTLFAVQMCALIASLLIVIFSFSFLTVVGAVLLNLLLYLCLTRMKSILQRIKFSSAFPNLISTKQNTGLYYDHD